MIPVGQKFLKVVPIAQANQEGAAISTNSADQLPELGQYVTHVVTLKYSKPSEVATVLQQFAKVPNSVFPLDSNGILILRDYTENVKRMLEMIDQIDVSVPSTFVSEGHPDQVRAGGRHPVRVKQHQRFRRWRVAALWVGGPPAGARPLAGTQNTLSANGAAGGANGAYGNTGNRLGAGGTGGHWRRQRCGGCTTDVRRSVCRTSFSAPAPRAATSQKPSTLTPQRFAARNFLLYEGTGGCRQRAKNVKAWRSHRR